MGMTDVGNMIGRVGAALSGLDVEQRIVAAEPSRVRVAFTGGVAGEYPVRGGVVESVRLGSHVIRVAGRGPDEVAKEIQLLCEVLRARNVDGGV